MDEDDATGGRQPEPKPQPQSQLVLRKSCDYCARMKRACDGGSPCSLCRRRGKVCERRLRRKSGPAKGAKYAPRRRKLDDEVALTEEEAAAAAAAAVAATRGRRCATGPNGKPPRADRIPGAVSASVSTPVTDTNQEHEDDRVGEARRAEASVTQPRQGMWRGGGGGGGSGSGSGVGGGQQWVEGGRRGPHCSDSGSRSSAATGSAAPYYAAPSTSTGASGSAVPYYPASSHGLLPHKREFSCTGDTGAGDEAARGGREHLFLSSGRDRARCGGGSNSSSSSSSGKVGDRKLSGGGGHPVASGRGYGGNNSNGGGNGGSDGVAAPSSPPSAPPLPSSACTSYSSKGTVGRMMVSASPLKGAGVGGERRRHAQQARAAGGEAPVSRIQAIEPSVRSSGEDFNFRSQREEAAAGQPPLRGDGGRKSPGQQQPLAPRDLLRMLRPDEGMIDMIADNDERRSPAPEASGGGGGDADCRRRSWAADDSRTRAEAGELLRGIRRHSASAAACPQDRSRERHRGGNGDRDTTAVVGRPRPAHVSSRRGGRGDDASSGPGDWPPDIVEGRPWRGEGGRPLPAGRSGGVGAGFAFGEQVHRGAGGWPASRARATDAVYVGTGGGGRASSSTKFGHGHGHGGYASGYDPHPRHQGDRGVAPTWRYDSNHVLESYPLPAHAGRGHHPPPHHHHLADAAARSQSRGGHFTPRYSQGHEAYQIHQPHHAHRAYLYHRSSTAGVPTGEGGSTEESGVGMGMGMHTRALLPSVEWTTAAGPRPDAAGVVYAKVIPADAPPSPSSTGAHGGGRGSGDDGERGRKAGVSAGGCHWRGGNCSAGRAPAPATAPATTPGTAPATAAAAPDVRLSHGDKDGDDAPWRVRSDGPFRKRGKMVRS